MRLRCLLLITMLLAAGVRADAPYPPRSIYHLPVELTDQSGAQHRLDVHRDHPVLITMFYGSCPVACPLLIDTLRALEPAIGAPERAHVRVLMISIDPDRDSVAALAKLAKERRIDTARWTVARADPASVRKIAAVLNIQYRQLPDGSFNHSSVITLLTTQGEIAAQSSVLGKPDPALVEALRVQLQ